MDVPPGRSISRAALHGSSESEPDLVPDAPVSRMDKNPTEQDSELYVTLNPSGKAHVRPAPRILLFVDIRL